MWQTWIPWTGGRDHDPTRVIPPMVSDADWVKVTERDPNAMPVDFGLSPDQAGLNEVQLHLVDFVRDYAIKNNEFPHEARDRALRISEKSADKLRKDVQLLAMKHIFGTEFIVSDPKDHEWSTRAYLYPELMQLRSGATRSPTNLNRDDLAIFVLCAHFMGVDVTRAFFPLDARRRLGWKILEACMKY